jgi:lipopolysaccharide transport system ATP-binding protein
MKPAIKVENLVKRYRLGALKHETMLRDAFVNALRMRRGRRQENVIDALDGLSFEVARGEVVGIVGRNGAGKSTLLKVLSRITYPTSGSIRVRGRVASLIEVGTGFHDELTGRENIFLNGSILGMKKREIVSRLDAIIDFAGVEKFIDTPIKRYSSGMRLRLGFAVAAHMEPDVLFVDEVLAVGDAEFQKKCLSAMDDLRSGGRTVMFVSHNMAAIENLCPRTIWIDSGKLRQDGRSSDVISDYLATFSQSQRTGYDLSAVGNRSGNGSVRFTRLEFVDGSGQPALLFRSGEPMRMRMYYRAEEKVKDPRFSVQLYSDMGTLITTVSTYVSNYYIDEVAPGEGCVEMEIPELRLLPNRYYITLKAETRGLKFDILDHVVSMDVEPSDVLGGRGMHPSYGLVYAPVSWELKAHEETG